jgi:deoxycytidine triphosphate deaminase
MGVQKVLTGVYGPIPTGTVGLIGCKSGLTSKGVQGFPGVVHEVYSGEIQILMSVDGATAFEKGQSIAQLLWLLHQPLNQTATMYRGIWEYGFQTCLLHTVSECRQTMLTIEINEKAFMGLLGTGGDIQFWPEDFGLQSGL